MLGLFKKKGIELVAPATGKVIDIKEVNDGVFSEKMLGDGIAIIPESGEIVSPFDGKVVSIFDTLHAITLQKDGINVLIHIGLDTVALKGEGFRAFVKEGQDVSKGDKLIEADLDFLAEKGCRTEIPVVIVESEYNSLESKKKGEFVEKGKDVVLLVK